MPAAPGAGERPPIIALGPALRPVLALAMGCHGNPDRCLRIGSWTSPVCARCIGFVIGNLGAVAAILTAGLPTPALALAGLACMAPVAVDGSRQLLGPYRSTTPRRLATGLLGGFGQILLLGGVMGQILGRV